MPNHNERQRAIVSSNRLSGQPSGPALPPNDFQAFTNGAVFKQFNLANDVLADSKEIVSATAWDDVDGVLTSFFTSSTETLLSASHWYYNVYQNAAEASSSIDPHFAIAYGNFAGLGSVTGSSALYTGNLTGSRTPSKAIYSQYKNILLTPNDTKFTFGTETPDDIYVINFNRARYKEKLDPGNWELHISGTVNNLQLMDNSGASTNPAIGQSGRVFNIVSGTVAAGTSSATPVYGLAYPEVGILVFNARAIEASASIGTETLAYVNPTGSNNKDFFTAISSSAYFQARNEENISSTFYFVRVPNREFNYSNNPSYITGSIGLIRYSAFHTDPRTYITTVGLYNDNNELLSVAKMSKPLLKSFTREALIRIKLQF